MGSANFEEEEPGMNIPVHVDILLSRYYHTYFYVFFMFWQNDDGMRGNKSIRAHHAVEVVQFSRLLIGQLTPLLASDWLR